MRVSLIFFCIVGGLVAACSPEGHESVVGEITRTDNGVIVAVEKAHQKPKFVRLEVISDDIIRVTATATDSFSTEKSLLVLPDVRKNIRWAVSEDDNSVVVSTPSIRALVHNTTGEVVFTDTAGHVLLEEQKGGGKSFVTKSIEGKPYFSILQKFFSGPKVARIGDQYMFGPSILVSPVYQYKARTRVVYLPAGASWYDFETFKQYEGGQEVKADAPLERLPLFVKSGSIIPVGPEIQYTEEKKADTLALYIFPGQNGSFIIYEDENTNYNYEKGQFSTIEIKYEEATRSVIIGKRSGEFPGMLKKRIFEIIWVRDRLEGGLKARPQRVVEYSGEEVRIIP